MSSLRRLPALLRSETVKRGREATGRRVLENTVELQTKSASINSDFTTFKANQSRCRYASIETSKGNQMDKRTIKIRIVNNDFLKTHVHLFPGDDDEHGAVFAVSLHRDSWGNLGLIVHRVFIALDNVDYLPGKFGYRALSAEFVARVSDYCHHNKLAISPFITIKVIKALNSRILISHPIGGDIRRSLIFYACLLYTSPSPRDATLSRMPSSA